MKPNTKHQDLWRHRKRLGAWLLEQRNAGKPLAHMGEEWDEHLAQLKLQPCPLSTALKYLPAWGALPRLHHKKRRKPSAKPAGPRKSQRDDLLLGAADVLMNNNLPFCGKVAAARSLIDQAEQAHNNG